MLLLQVSSGSVRVVATIRVRSQADGDTAKAVLSDKAPDQLSIALGVSVLSVEPINLLDAASAAQSAPSDVGSARGAAPVIYIGIASGVAGCLLCLCIAVAIERSRRKRLQPRTGTVASVTTASSMAVAVDLVTQAPPKGQQTPTGARFDPNTGRPIPKFDPQTGVQNW